MAKWTAAFAVLALVASAGNPAAAHSDKCAVKTSSSGTTAPTTAPTAVTTAPTAVTTAPTAVTTVPTAATTAPTGSSGSFSSMVAVGEESSTPTPSTSAVAEGTDAPATTSSSSSGTSVGDITIDPTVTAVNTIESTYQNWVGPNMGVAAESACYREAHVMSTCPLGYEESLATCWAQCPLSYPVECGMECLPQSGDCALESLTKVASVGWAALSMATMGIFGELATAAKGVGLAVTCGKNMIGVVRSMMKYIQTVKTSDPQTSQDKLLTLLYTADMVVVDLPVAVMACMGLPVPANAQYTDEVLSTAEVVLYEVMTNGDQILANWDNFKNFIKSAVGVNAVEDLTDEADITTLQDALASNTTCGFDMKRLTDRSWMEVQKLREATPGISEDDLRLSIGQSELVLSVIPTVTNNCMGELIGQTDTDTAYQTRDTLRKTFGVILDDLIETGSSDNGTTLSSEEYAQSVAEKALNVMLIFDPTGLSLVASEFLQSVCGPTEFVGEVDDGSASDAVGLTTVGDAFNSSTGTWEKVGDGSVTIAFTSKDTEDVTVNILSGGDEIDDVDVAAGETVTWTSTVEELEGKTLYLDRWRPGFLGLPGTGGGSLKMWVPRSPQGGHLELNAVLNES